MFGAGGTGTATVTLSEVISAAGLTFNTGATYRLTGETLTRTGSIAVNAAEARIDSVLAGSRINKYGAGTLILAGDNTVGSDALDINGGVVSLRHNNALGNHAYAHVYNIGTAVEVQDNVTIPKGIYIKEYGVGGTGSLRSVSGDNTWAGYVRLHWGYPDSSIGVDAGSTLTITGTVEASGGTNGALRKVGAGTLILTANNPYHWPTYVEAGVLNIRHNNALGTTAGSTMVNTGAALEVQGDITVGEAITLNGPSLLRSVSGANVWNGSINLAGTSASNIQVDTGSTLTLAGVVSGDPGENLVKVGDGTLILSGDNTYGGETHVNAGLLDLRHGNALGAGAVNVASGAAIRVQDNIAVSTGMLSLNGGTALRSIAGQNT